MRTEFVEISRRRFVQRATAAVSKRQFGSIGATTIASEADAVKVIGPSSLAIVPYASGDITVRREQGDLAEIVSHYFGGSLTRSEASTVNGLLTVTAVHKAADRTPLVWIEVRIT